MQILWINAVLPLFLIRMMHTTWTLTAHKADYNFQISV